MKPRQKFSLLTGALIAWLIICALYFIFRQKPMPEIKNYATVEGTAKIKPDYTDTVIPPNISPLNFAILEPAQEYAVKIYCSGQDSINILSKDGIIKIPSKPWQQLLNTNKGNKLYFDIFTKDTSSNWQKFQTITNTIAPEEIDPYIAYRLIKPVYNWWKSIGIYQRNLSNFRQSTILHGKSFDDGCLNCHSFASYSPYTMTIGFRSAVYDSATILAQGNQAVKIGAKWGYTAWHPTGRLAVYSINKVRQFFHTNRSEIRDVVDLDSALAYYLVDAQVLKSSAAIAEPDRLETYPTWSPDGKYLYFCSAAFPWSDRDQMPPENFEKVKYDLRRVRYDIENDSWEEPETVLSAQKTGLSILAPKISPDGKFLVFCMCEYGCFPVYQPSSDLYLMNLQTRRYKKLDINSPFSESWHSFSSNSKWLAFSSKKRDGLFTRTYFSYIDNSGNAQKPFILPQKDPLFYDSLLETFSVPEFITAPVKVSPKSLARAVRWSKQIEVELPLSGATSKPESSDPWQQRE